MARRISSRRREAFSELVSTETEQNVVCEQKIAHAQPRKLVYRRLRGLEQTFDGRWPSKTDIRCWYCRLPFETTPIPIVQQYDPVKDQYDVYGITCSPACSKAFIARGNNNDCRTRLIWQNKMLIEVFGWPRDKPVPMADDWEALDVFGGYMPVDEWRKVHPGVKIRVKQPPFVPFHVYTETEHRGLSVIDQTKTDFSAADRVESLEEQAVMHGAVFTLKGLQRPPEDQIIRTHEQLHKLHPQLPDQQQESLFQHFLDTQQLPSDAECAEERAKREADRKRKRKRKRKPAPAAEGTNEG